MSKATDGIFGGYANTAPTDITGGVWNVEGSDGFTWGMKFSSTRSCTISSIWLYVSGYTAGNTIVSALFDTSGTQLNSQTFTGVSSGTGYAAIGIDPYTIAANTDYVICAQVFAGVNSGYLAGTGPSTPYTSGPFTFKQSRWGFSGNLYADTAGFATIFGIDIQTNLTSIVPGLSDTITLSDAAVKAVGVALSPSDTLSLSEATKATFGLNVLDSPIALTDVSAFLLGSGFNITIAETISLLDSTSFLTAALALDSLSILDGISSSVGIPLSPADTLSLSDRVSTGNPTLIDYLSLIDSVALSSGIPTRVIVDSFNLSDSTLPRVSFSLKSSDTNSLTDRVQANAPPRLSADTNTLSDVAAFTLSSIFVSVQYSVSDKIQLFSSHNLSGKGLNPKLGDSYSLLDSVYPLLVSVQGNYLRSYLNDVI